MKEVDGFGWFTNCMLKVKMIVKEKRHLKPGV